MGQCVKRIGRTGAGLAVCAAALAALLGAAGQGSTGQGSAGQDAPEAAEECRTGGGDGGRDGHVTPEQAAEYERELREARVPQSAHRERRTVPVVVHVVSASDGTGDLSADTVREQVRVLDRAFGGGYGGADTGFDFELEETVRTVDDRLFSTIAGQGARERAEMRRGGPETLNLFTADLGRGVLGRSTFPQDYSEDPGGDGVVVDHRTVPGGAREHFDRGHTATHEAGHWLGLFHTFQNGCSWPGDYVGDTPYEREQASGCPVGRDTCPARPGSDPVRNFMNYSDDACMSEFTDGQAERMAAHWYAFRAGHGAQGVS